MQVMESVTNIKFKHPVIINKFLATVNTYIHIHSQIWVVPIVSQVDVANRVCGASDLPSKSVVWQEHQTMPNRHSIRPDASPQDKDQHVGSRTCDCDP